MNETFKWVLRCLMTFGLLAATSSQANTQQQLNIAVAANFLQAFKEIQALYEEQTGHHLQVSSGSTGQLYHQIIFGAPFDIFFSADELTSQRLIAEKKALANSYGIYALGRLVLLSHEPLTISDNFSDLASALENKRIAIANPKTAPYGKAAQEVLTHLSPENAPKGNIITAQNVTQVFQFIHSGNVDMGFISLAQLRHAQNLQQKRYHYLIVPENFYRPIKQSRVILSTSEKQQQAMDFLAFLDTSKIKKILDFYGYE